MGWKGRTCCSWLLLLALVFGNVGVLGRRRRQSDQRRSRQRAVPGHGSSRLGSRELHWGVNAPVLGFGHSRGESLWGSGGGRAGGMPRELPPAGGSSVSVQCGEDVLIISVNRNFYKNGKLVKPSDLSLGPQRCKPSAPSTDTVLFQVGLQDCGNSLQMTPDWMIYSTNLTYSPTSSRDVPITRTSSAVIPIHCYYTRHGNTSSKAVRPTWVPFSSTVSIEEIFAFSLHLMADDWSGPRTSMVFQLGDAIYIEASVDIQNHIGLTLFVDSCVATISPDPSSAPRYEIIKANGCLVDGKEDTSSAFVSPRISPDRLRFTVDAFRFLNVNVSVIYITCQLRAVAVSQVPDALNKACSYSKATTSWSAVEGPDDICQCCDAETCMDPSGGPRSWPSFGRRHWKREVGLHSEEVGQAALGPLLVIEAQGQPALGTRLAHAPSTSPESRPVELLMLVAVASVSLVLVAAVATLIGKCVLSRLSSVMSVSGGRGIKGSFLPLPSFMVLPGVRMALAVSVWLLLVCGLVDGGAPVRWQRQADWWRHYQAPIRGSPRGAHREIASRPLVGLGSLRGNAQYGRGPSNWYSGAHHRQILQTPPSSSPITIQCTEDSIVVMVRRDFYGNGIRVQPSELSLGPQSCKPSLESNDTTVLFINDLQDCGSTLQMTLDTLIYSSILTYSPLSNGVVIRSNPAVVPINCIYSRYGNVSSNAIKPTWAPFSTTVSSQDKLFFSLQLMNDDWSGPRSSSIFQLGQSLNIEASVDSQNHMDLILFVDYCVATVSPDPGSSPSYEIIAANGCFMDAMRDDTTSAFRSPRVQQDSLQFTVEAFRFLGVDTSVIYITCHLRAVSTSQVPDSMNKACSYNRDRNSWSTLEGSSDICQCCTSGTCQKPSIPGGSRGNVGRHRGSGRPRNFGKRHVGHHSEKQGDAILGPLLVIGTETQPAPRTGLNLLSKTTAESQPLERWVLVAVASVSLVAVSAGVAWIGKLLLNKLSHKAVK
ncbi:uncharacterized protein ACMZJ9_004495 [Mantella aurantiaca]